MAQSSPFFEVTRKEMWLRNYTPSYSGHQIRGSPTGPFI